MNKDTGEMDWCIGYKKPGGRTIHWVKVKAESWHQAKAKGDDHMNSIGFIYYIG